MNDLKLWIPDPVAFTFVTFCLVAIGLGARRKKDWTFGALCVPIGWFWLYYAATLFCIEPLESDPYLRSNLVRLGLCGLSLTLGMYALNGRVLELWGWVHRRIVLPAQATLVRRDRHGQ